MPGFTSGRNIWKRSVRKAKIGLFIAYLAGKVGAMEGAANEFGRSVAAARARLGWSQARVCDAINLSEPFLSGVEKGRRVPRLPILAKLFSVLGQAVSDPRLRQDELAHWLACWVVAEAASPRSDTLRTLPPELNELLGSSADRLREAVRRSIPRPARTASSLADLRGFGPFIALCADRREPEPRSLADLFILSGAISDLTWFPHVPEGLIASVRTDKLVVQMPTESLVEEFGRYNLLVIAGPNVNWAARLLNPSALFRTRVEPGWEEWDRRLRATTDLNQRSVVAAFAAVLGAARFGANRRSIAFDEAALANHPHLGAGALKRARELADTLLRGPDNVFHTPREIIGEFQFGGLVDPVERVVHNVGLQGEVNLARISLAPHPWAREEGLVAVIVAGTGGPGTTEALRVLFDEPEQFVDRPFGGVMEVRLPALENWASRFHPPTWSWVTSPYAPADLPGLVGDDAARELVDRLVVSGHPSESK